MPKHLPAGHTLIQFNLLYQFDVSGSIAENTFYVDSPGAVADSATAIGYGNTFDGLMGTGLVALLPSNMRYIGCNVYVNDNTNIVEIHHSNSVTGTLGGAALPDVMSIVVNRQAGGLARNRFGRIFFPPPTETQMVNANDVDPAHLANINTFFSQFTSGFNLCGDLGASALIFHPSTNTGTEIILYAAAGVLRTMRSRTPGRGI